MKERDPAHHKDETRLEKAGAKAEEDLAHFLAREFRDHPDIWVFNDLRFKDSEDDVAQIDHLLLHKYGIIVIESKSVSTVVRMNERGEWERQWDGKWKGMPSPLEQARRQIKFLQRAFEANVETMLRKILGLQTRFGSYSWEVMVAVSVDGRINRASTKDFTEVMKADQIPGAVRALFQRHKQGDGLLSVNAPVSFNRTEMQNINTFLLRHHYPLVEEKKSEPANVPQSPPPLPPQKGSRSLPIRSAPEACRKCGQPSRIEWGRYGYYWKCNDCGANLAVQEACAKCKGKFFLRKDGPAYFVRCETCKTSEFLYFVSV